MSEGREDGLSPAIRRTVEIMHARNWSIAAFTGRRGRKRYILPNNEPLARSMVEIMKDRELIEFEKEEDGIAYYRLVVK